MYLTNTGIHSFSHRASNIDSSAKSFSSTDKQASLLLVNIYSQYNFTFSCDFENHKELKLLAYAKPLIQFFVDQLINALKEKKAGKPLSREKLESLVKAFTPMFLNRLARVSDEVLLADPRIQALRDNFFPLPGHGRFEPYVVQIQNYEFVEYINAKYPDLFPQLIQVSENWLGFVLAFSAKLKP